MTSDGSNIMKLDMHVKQCLNEFHKIDQLLKTVTNDTTHIPRWISKYNHLNMHSVIDDIKRLGTLKHMWEGNEHGEKYMQTANSDLLVRKATLVK